MADFNDGLMTFFMELIDIGPAYIRDGWKGCGGVVEKAKKRSNMTQKGELRVVMTSICIHKGPMFHYKAYTNVHWQWEPY